MSDSHRLTAMLRRHEGVRPHVYRCPAGYETIGVGRNISTHGLGLSSEEINHLLNNDIARCRRELTAVYAWSTGLDPVRRDALIDLLFNLGLTRLAGFRRFIGAMAAGNWDRAADELLDSRYACQVGDRARELAQMIRTGDYTDGT